MTTTTSTGATPATTAAAVMATEARRRRRGTTSSSAISMESMSCDGLSMSSHADDGSGGELYPMATLSGGSDHSPRTVPEHIRIVRQQNQQRSPSSGRCFGGIAGLALTVIPCLVTMMVLGAEMARHLEGEVVQRQRIVLSEREQEIPALTNLLRGAHKHGGTGMLLPGEVEGGATPTLAVATPPAATPAAAAPADSITSTVDSSPAALEQSAEEEAPAPSASNDEEESESPSSMINAINENTGIPKRGFEPNPDFYGYQSQEEMDARSERFPSIQERVQLYMSDWYLPPCEEDAKIFYYFDEEAKSMIMQELPDPNNKFIPHYSYDGPARTFEINGNADMNRIIYLDREEHDPEHCIFSYCSSTAESMYPAMDRVQKELDDDDNLVILLQYGDQPSIKAPEVGKSADEMSLYPNVPIFKKYRVGFTENTWTVPVDQECRSSSVMTAHPNLDEMSIVPPIIWKQKADRHFGMLDTIDEAGVRWKGKIDKALFRGSMTGWRNAGLTNADLDEGNLETICQKIPRCWLVMQHLDSTMIDAKMTGNPEEFKTHLHGNDLTQLLDGALFTEEHITYHFQLKYKAIIMPEGNDVATGLKWALLSESVVMMPPPKRTSWAMEEILEPWVHYVPLKPDMSDAEEKMQWILDNNVEAQHIAHQGSLFMRDMALHPDAQSDEDAIYDEILRRYQAHFQRVDDPSLIPVRSNVAATSE